MDSYLGRDHCQVSHPWNIPPPLVVDAVHGP